jgi:hypothetical protein
MGKRKTKAEKETEYRAGTEPYLKVMEARQERLQQRLREVAQKAAAWRAANPVCAPRQREQVQDKEKEAKLQRRLGVELIDIGYKALESKLHPDKGGSQEAMSRLNRVRSLLKGALP